MPSADTVLCLNAGSSSLKFSLFEVDASSERRLATGSIADVGTAQARASLTVAGKTQQGARPPRSTSAIDWAFELLETTNLPRPTLIGHRVVHGGPKHTRPTSIDAEMMRELQALVPLAPLHQPAAIQGMASTFGKFPDLPQVACFDTAFHATIPEFAKRYPLPAPLDAAGVHRYGFHGLSYEYILDALGPERPAKIVIAHLGNGASLAAVANGRCIDTTMGFTPAGGIMMGTRSGDLDPGILFYLLREQGYSVDSLEALLERESGLLGVGGTTDVRALIERSARDDSARLALDMFAYAIKKAIGAYIAALGGIDLLVFTGGIGEHSAAVRAAACDGLSRLGISLDAERNIRNEAAIGSDASPAAVYVIATDEDRMIARHTRATLRP